jgi:hypothetical protein
VLRKKSIMLTGSSIPSRFDEEERVVQRRQKGDAYVDFRKPISC